jgi:hypothetical protein
LNPIKWLKQLKQLHQFIYNLSIKQLNAIAYNPVIIINSATMMPLILDGGYAIDFNPVSDLLRLVSTLGSNVSINPNDGLATIQTAINGDARTIYGIAYTNNVNPPPATTTLYDLGILPTSENALFIQAPPASGTTFSQGLTSYNVNPFYVKFDILTIGNTNMGYGLSYESRGQVRESNNLYFIEINGPASATFLGSIDTGSSANLLLGFALIPSAIPCLHPNTMVASTNKNVRISDLRAGDEVFDMKGNTISIVNSIQFASTEKFYKILSNSIAPNIPSKDILIRPEHPIIYKGQEVTPKKLRKLLGNTKVQKVKLARSVPVWSLVTKERTFVMMENLPVCTWADDELKNHKKFRHCIRL